MNALAHTTIGAAAGAGCITAINYSLGLETGPGDLVFGVVVGIIGSSLPDILEPASHPHHRSFFHSSFVAGLMVWANWKLHSSTDLTPDQKRVLGVLSAGYFSHLAADSLTPMGLPLLA